MPQTQPADAPSRAAPRFAALGRGELREALEPHFLRLQASLPADEARQAVDNALALCRTLYANARSAEALVLARSALERARAIGEPGLLRKACTACGVLSADTADLAGALEHHAQALRLAMAAGDMVEVGRVWNTIGSAMGISGHYELAARCY